MSGFFGGGGGGGGTTDHAALASNLAWTTSGHTGTAGNVAAFNAASTAAALVPYTTVGKNVLGLTNPGAITFIKIAADNSVSAESAATYRTSLGATTVGGNIFTLTNPGAITFLKVAADNTVSTESAATHRTSLGVGTADAPQFGSIELGAASDTTLTRSAAGKVAVEGKAVPLMSGAVDAVFAGPTAARTYTFPDADSTVVTLDGTQTLTNKTLSGFTMTDGTNVVLDSTTGTKIGTGTTQKLGFFNATPVAQQSVPAAFSNTGNYAADGGNIQGLLNGIRTAGANLGLWA